MEVPMRFADAFRSANDMRVIDGASANRVKHCMNMLGMLKNPTLSVARASK
jgi:hypothetical protein